MHNWKKACNSEQRSREAEKHSQQSNRRHALNLHTTTLEHSPEALWQVPPLIASQSYSLYFNNFDTSESGRAKPSNAAKANVLQSWAHVRVDETANTWSLRKESMAHYGKFDTSDRREFHWGLLYSHSMKIFIPSSHRIIVSSSSFDEGNYGCPLPQAELPPGLEVLRIRTDGPLITAQDQKAKRIQTPKKEIQKGVNSGCNLSNPQ